MSTLSKDKEASPGAVRVGTPRRQARSAVSRRDVAAAAGVSVTTVTHSLSPVPGVRVKPETAERVKRIARDLGYRPNFVGKALVKGRTMAVGILLPSTGILAYQLHQDLVLGMASAMDRDDYHLLLLFRSPDNRFLNSITQGRVDAVFVLQSDMATDYIAQIIETGIPIVIVNLDYAPPSGKPVGCVRSDHESMIRDAVQDLVSYGCKSLLLLIDPRWINANLIMLQAFLQETGGRAADGIVGSVMTPHDENFRVQIRTALASGQRWDGILTDRNVDAEILLEEALACGLTPGVDFHLITTDTKDGRTTRSQAESRAYTQQPQKVGAEAWQLLKALMNDDLLPAPAERMLTIPYRRYDLSHPDV